MQKWYLAFASCRDKRVDTKVGKKFFVTRNSLHILVLWQVRGGCRRMQVILLRVCLALFHFWTFTVLAVDVRKREIHFQRVDTCKPPRSCDRTWKETMHGNWSKEIFLQNWKKKSQVRIKPWMANHTVTVLYRDSFTSVWRLGLQLPDCKHNIIWHQ